jgi:hypothetical protein
MPVLMVKVRSTSEFECPSVNGQRTIALVVGCSQASPAHPSVKSRVQK